MWWLSGQLCCCVAITQAGAWEPGTKLCKNGQHQVMGHREPPGLGTGQAWLGTLFWDQKKHSHSLLTFTGQYTGQVT